MKSLRIPENQIYNAYLIEGEDMAMVKADGANSVISCISDLPSLTPRLGRCGAGIEVGSS